MEKEKPVEVLFGDIKMNYNSIDKCECRNGLGWGVTLYVQGCHFHCKGCFNPETWDFYGGKKFTEKTRDTILKLLELNQMKHFTIQGGEPLEACNVAELNNLVDSVKAKRPDIKIWIYTGYKIEELIEYLLFNSMTHENYYPDTYNLIKILDKIDYLVDGQFQEDKKDLTYPFAGSTNQRVIAMQESRKQNKIVLLDI